MSAPTLHARRDHELTQGVAARAGGAAAVILAPTTRRVAVDSRIAANIAASAARLELREIHARLVWKDDLACALVVLEERA